jgi:GTPase SAR1 family protein
MTASNEDFLITHRQIGELIEATRKLVDAEHSSNPGNGVLSELASGLERTRLKWKEESFRVAALGLVKSGKSTLLNAFLGDEYLPAANAPETARIVRVRGGPPPGTLTVGDRQLAQGTSAINEHLRAANREVRAGSGVKRSETLTLTAPLAFVNDIQLETRGFEILDTPGPNEAGVRQDLHKEVVKILGDVDAIIYLLDYTKLKTVEEASLLDLLATMRPELIRRCSERLYFVVNKIDTEDRNGLSHEQTCEYVADLLRRTLRGITVREERILSISANHALLARMVHANVASEDALADFRRIAFGKVRGPERSLEACHSAATELLDSSELVTLEREVLTYIFENRGRLLHQSLSEELERCLRRFGNHLRTVEGSLQTDHQVLETRLAELKTEFSTVTEGLQRVTKAGRDTKAEVEAWVREEFEAFDEEVQALIRKVLGDQPPRERESGFIMSLWRRVRDLQSDVGPEPLEVTQARIKDLNLELQRLLDRQFFEFRSQLEQEAHDRQTEVLAELNRLLQPLARSIERKVNQTLNITLSPVSIAIPAPSLAELNHDINSFMTQRIRMQTSSMTQQRRIPGGLCSPPHVVNETVLVNTPVFEASVSVEALKTAWHTAIQQLTEGSIATAGAVIDAAFESIHAKARAEVERYALGFTRTIESEILESERGKEQRATRIAAIRSSRQSADSLLEVASTLTKQVDRSAASNQPNVHVIAEHADVRITGGDMTNNETKFNGGVQVGVAVGESTAVVASSTVTVGASAGPSAVDVNREQFERDVTEILAMLVDAREELAADYELVRVALRKLHQVDVDHAETLQSVQTKFAAVLTEQDKTALEKLADARDGIAANLVSSGIWDYVIKPVLGT